MVPDELGWDGVSCVDSSMRKGPINYYITSLDSRANIYNLFVDTLKKNVAYKLMKRQYDCDFRGRQYFSIFFQRDYLASLKSLSKAEPKTRGAEVDNTNCEPTNNGITRKKLALVIGTDNYTGAGWDKLNNADYDAKEVAAILKKYYGYKTELLLDASMEKIYDLVRKYYRDSIDQVIVYIAGHGDHEQNFFDEGFIVCNDSRSRKDDPYRNSYIPFGKLRTMINNMHAREILVMLDICHGGVFDASLLGRFEGGRPDPGKLRIILSAVGDKPAFDGQAGNHSPFAKFLLQTLEKGANDKETMDNDDIYAQIRAFSKQSTDGIKLQPAMNYFGNSGREEKFLFQPVNNKQQ